MAIVWILTIGNSDIQLTYVPDSWQQLCRDKRADLRPCIDDFLDKKGINHANEWYAILARLFGIIFNDNFADYWKFFRFPLLNEFFNKLTTEKIKPDRIIVLLTDQEAIFDAEDRADPNSPYWKDTCTLEPILKHYFMQVFDKKFVNEKIEFSILKPQQGADG